MVAGKRLWFLRGSRAGAKAFRYKYQFLTVSEEFH